MLTVNALKAIPHKKAVRLLVVAIMANLLAVILLFAQPGYAQTSTSGIKASDISLDVNRCDPSMNLLNAILSGGGGQTFKDDFRGAGTTCSAGDFVWKASTPTGPVAKLFLYLNTLAMLFAGSLLIYILVVGTLRSAEDGEVLGRSWSTLWVPLRATIGFGALVPTSSGFSWVQIAVLWLTAQGVGGGNYLWTNTVKDVFSNPGELVAIRNADASGISKVMITVLKGETCVRYLNKQFAAAVGAAPSSTGPYGRVVTTDSSSGTSISWGNTTAGGYHSKECGHIEVDGLDSRLKPNQWLAGNMRSAQAIVQKAQAAGILSAAESMGSLAETLAADASLSKETSTAQELVLQKKIVSAVVKATASLRDAVEKQASTGLGAEAFMSSGKTLSQLTNEMTSGIIEDSKRNGWIGAGSFYYTMAITNSKINEITSKVPATTPAEVSDDSSTFSFPKFLSDRIDKAFNPQSLKAAESEWAAGSSDLDDMIGGAVNNGNSKLRRWSYELVSVDPTNDKHALVQLKNVGDAIVSATEIIIYGSLLSDFLPSPAGAAVSGGVDRLLDFGPFKLLKKASSKEASTMAMVFSCLLLLSILTGAILLAYWIPMAPFVIWIGGIFGWVVSILEMLGASILWAAAHLHPEGEGMAGKYGANGYMIIIEVALRPALMITGLLLSFAVIDPFLRFNSSMFFKAMDIANQDTFAALIGFVCFVGMYVGINVTLVHKTNALIHMIPNSIFKWIGAHANSYDDGAAADAIQKSVSGYLEKTGKAANAAAPGVFAATAPETPNKPNATDAATRAGYSGLSDVDNSIN